MRGIGTIIATLAVVGAASCDFNDPDEIQNEANLAVIRMQVFESRTNRVPVPGVRVVVESPEESERPYVGPDVIGISGEDGMVEIRVFPGFVEQDEGSGGSGGGGTSGGDDQTTQGPQNPLELPRPLIFADVAVTFIVEGRVIPFLTGLTVGSGRLHDLGPIHLSDFGLVES